MHCGVTCMVHGFACMHVIIATCSQIVFFLYSASNLTALTDVQPYAVGPNCSECPSHAPLCDNNALCSECIIIILIM